jgi:hypothetical protein
MSRRRDALIISAIAFAALAVMARQLIRGEVCSIFVSDTAYYFNWTRQLAASLAEGNLYPRWMPMSHAGFGSPTFIFYPPLVSYVTALVYKASGDVILSVNLVNLAALFLSGLTMYVFVKDLGGAKAGLVSAAVYMVLPLRIFDLYISGMYSIKFTFALLPLVLYLARKAARTERVGVHTAWLASAYFLLTLAHPLASYMMLPVTSGFAAVSAGRGRRLEGLVRAVIAAFLGVSLSAFYILPALRERGLVHFEELQTYYWNDFWRNFIFNPLGQYRTGLHPLLYAGAILTALAGFAMYMYSSPPGRRRWKAEPVFFMAVIVAVLFMMSSYSGFLWAGVPGMKMLQFSKRWLYVLVTCSACLSGIGFSLAHESGAGMRTPARAAWGIIVLISLAGVAYFDARVVGGAHSLDSRDLAAISRDRDVFEYVPSAVSLDWLKCEETWRVYQGAEMAEVSRVEDGKPGRLDFKVGGWGAEARSVTVDTDADAALRLRTFNYPGWHAYIDGREAPISTEGISGAMLVEMPKGRHELSLKFTDTPYRKAAKLISAASALGVAYLFTRRRGLLA